MRPVLRTAAVAVASLLLVPQLVAADDVNRKIEEMMQRLEALEAEVREHRAELADARVTVAAQHSQLQIQSAELTDARARVAAQQIRLDETQTLVTDEREATSALSSFLESTDISGFVAAGWHRTDPDTNADLDERSSFNLDQAWISINKAATAESRAGFNIEFEMGQLADTAGDNNTPGLYAASVSYLAPLGNGLLLDGGILSTALGAEVEAQNGNWQIRRGLVFGLQPVTNTGLTATYGVTDDLSIMMGVLNDAFASQRNQNGAPGSAEAALGLTSQVAYSGDKFGAKLGFNYGGGTGSAANLCDTLANALVIGGVPCATVIDNAVAAAGLNPRSGIVDAVVTFDPMDNLSLWANYDYTYMNLNANSLNEEVFGIHGLAIAGRIAVTDDTGFSGRFEYLTGEVLQNAVGSAKTYTLTFDRELTAGLTGKFEYAHTTLSPDDVTFTGAPDVSSNQLSLQMLYDF